MRRIALALLVCLISLQSFAGVVMNARMASMSASMVSMVAINAPCHEAAQPLMVAAHHDCCDSQVTCHNLCQVFIAPPVSFGVQSIALTNTVPFAFDTSFQSAESALGFKPPIL